MDSNNNKESFGIVLRGLAMGAADVIPGVSGGTIAFITGIYERLISALNQVDAKLFNLLLTFQWKEMWQKLDGKFLLLLFAGIGISIFSLAGLMSYLLENHKELVWSFFFGLIAASAWWISLQFSKKNLNNVALLLIGTAIGFYISYISPSHTPEGLPYVFVSGAIAICAMILPGISGGYILVLLGKYEMIINSIKELDFSVLIVFALGCVLGLLSFAKFLQWMFQKRKEMTLALLTGFMVGSLYKVWPWKNVVETYTDRHGVVKPLIEENILAPINSDSLYCLALMIVGFLTVFAIEKAGNKAKK